MRQKHARDQGYLSAFVLALTIVGALLLFAFLQPTCAQEVTSAITGTITDPSGAAIPGAQVTATDVLLGTLWPTQTNAAGVYNIPRLPVGRYTVKVSVTGFETVVQPAFELQMNQICRLDFQLKVGEVTQTVNVTSAYLPLAVSSANQRQPGTVLRDYQGPVESADVHQPGSSARSHARVQRVSRLSALT